MSGPTKMCRTSRRRASGNARCFSRWLMEPWNLVTDWTLARINGPLVASVDGDLSGGGIRPGDVLPPPSLIGRTLNPKRTRSLSSRRCSLAVVGKWEGLSNPECDEALVSGRTAGGVVGRSLGHVTWRASSSLTRLWVRLPGRTAGGVGVLRFDPFLGWMIHNGS